MKSKLGKGLGALIADEVLTSSITDIPKTSTATQTRTSLPLESIRPNPKQPRRDFSDEALADLAASIKQKGVIQPIVVTPSGPGIFEIVAGERRWRASRLAGLQEIPTVVRTGSETELFEVAIIENLQREDLNPIELALGFLRLQDVCGMTQEAIAKAVGKERSVIANSLRLLTLSAPIQSALRQGQLTTGHAKALLSIEDPHKRDIIFAQVLSDRLTVRAIEELARSSKNRGTSPESHPDNALEIEKIQTSLEFLLRRKTSIVSTNDYAGHIKLSFSSREDFKDLIRKLKTLQ